MQTFHRHHHRLIGKILGSLDGDFLRRTRCYFGGGTQIVLAMGEYRESRDIDFLCADREGYRLLRETITNLSLGNIACKKIALAREIRADRDGIRTFFALNNSHIKFEIIREARIELRGRFDANLGVPVLSRECAIAEKFLAHTDRGLDRSTQMRDLIDLAFLAANSNKKTLTAGYSRAISSYGTSVSRHLALTMSEMGRNSSPLVECIQALAVTNITDLSVGLLTLQQLLGKAAITPGAHLSDALEDIERDAIVRALEQTRYNKTKAAQLLGMSFRSLRYRIKKLGIE